MDRTSHNGIQVISVVQSLKPSGEGWIEVDGRPMPDAITCSYWMHAHGFYVISAVEKVTEPGEIDKGPEYHLSFSRQTPYGPERVDTNDAMWILKEFGLEGALEDNHVPNGKARNFWRTVREDLIGYECACVEDEPAIRENKGDYIWRPA